MLCGRTVLIISSLLYFCGVGKLFFFPDENTFLWDMRGVGRNVLILKFGEWKLFYERKSD
jgi:hypothetical protein